jgi:hypothetical protein
LQTQAPNAVSKVSPSTTCPVFESVSYYRFVVIRDSGVCDGFTCKDRVSHRRVIDYKSCHIGRNDISFSFNLNHTYDPHVAGEN